MTDNKWINLLRCSFDNGMVAAQHRRERKQLKRESKMTDETDKWTDEEFCEELGKRVIKFYEANGGKSFWLKRMPPALVGQQFRAKAKGVDENYSMLEFQAIQELERKEKAAKL